MDKAFYADKAEKLFREGCNCSQAVFAAFCDVTGFSTEQALKISSGFGGGFGNDDVRDSGRKNGIYALTGSCMDSFSARLGSCVCREILGMPKGEYSPISSARTSEFYNKRPCVQCIRTAAEITAEVLGEHGCR